jgi:hypothetical protein
MQLHEWHEKFMDVKRDIGAETVGLHMLASAARRMFMKELAIELDATAHAIENAITELDQATGSMIRDEVGADVSAMHETLATCVTGIIGHVASENTEKEN